MGGADGHERDHRFGVVVGVEVAERVGQADAQLVGVALVIGRDVAGAVDQVDQLSERERLAGSLRIDHVPAVLLVLVDDAVADRARLVVSCADADRICRGRIEVDACDLDLVAVEVRQELAAEERWVQTAERGRLPRRESAREGDVGICGQRRRAVLQPRTGGRAAHRARDRSEHRRLARRLGPVGVGPRGEVVPGVEHVSDARHLTLLRDPARRRPL